MTHKWARSTMLLLAVVARLGCGGASAIGAAADTPPVFDVVIAGGSTAALAAAFTAAEEGATVALLEPTDWIGGQLTASGVPAVDEAWHKITDPASGEVVLDVARIARERRHMPPFFRDALFKIGNPGRGWVSRFCFQPRQLLDGSLLPREHRLSTRLVVFRETVVKRAEVDALSGEIVRITAIRRVPRSGVANGGYDRLPSRDLTDWYSPTPSARFDKEVLHFGRQGQKTVFLDATEWGELLVLSGAEYLQGPEPTEHASTSDDRCGQAITFGFVQRYNDRPVRDRKHYPTVPGLGFGAYRDTPDAWSRVWTYRRIAAAGDGPTPGDLSLQNWGYDPESGESGNDYPHGPLLLPKQEALAQVPDWRGGVDLAVMRAAERQALAWHEWYRRQAPRGVDPDCFTLAAGVLGTGHGLSKLPYVRDTRRSIGLAGFRLRFSDLVGPAERRTGTVFADRVAIGAYAADIHPLAGCRRPEGVDENHQTLPFYIPYRSLTCEERPNLLVAGKTMAQTFLANSATRLHPTEWSTGCAAGAAAAYLARTGMSTREAFDMVGDIQAIAARHTPAEWVFTPTNATATDGSPPGPTD